MDLAAQASGPTCQMNVLYVEDYPIQARLVHDILSRRAPHLVLYHARSAADALRRLRAFETVAGPLPDADAAAAPASPGVAAATRYDLMLCDMELPDGSGLDIVQHVRQRGLPLAVVMLTGNEESDGAAAAMAAGADAFVAKQGDYLNSLPQVLQTALHNYRNATRSDAPDQA